MFTKHHLLPGTHENLYPNIQTPLSWTSPKWINFEPSHQFREVVSHWNQQGQIKDEGDNFRFKILIVASKSNKALSLNKIKTKYFKNTWY